MLVSSILYMYKMAKLTINHKKYKFLYKYFPSKYTKLSPFQQIILSAYFRNTCINHIHKSYHLHFHKPYPTSIKPQGFYREAKCQLQLGEVGPALHLYTKVLELDPRNKAAANEVWWLVVIWCVIWC